MFATPKKPTVLLDGSAEVFFNYPVETDFEWVDVGFGRLVYCSTEQVKQLPQDYFALSVSLSSQKWQDLSSFLSVDVIKTEQTEDFFSQLCYCDFFMGGVTIDGQKVNLQVAWQGDSVKVGFPLIVGSF